MAQYNEYVFKSNQHICAGWVNVYDNNGVMEYGYSYGSRCAANRGRSHHNRVVYRIRVRSLERCAPGEPRT